MNAQTYEDFAWAFSQIYLNDALKNNKNDICFSPIGVYLPLCAIAYGSSGNVAAEFRQALCLSKEEDFLSFANTLCSTLLKEPVITEFANAFRYPEKGMRKEYLDTLRSVFSGSYSETTSGSTVYELTNIIAFQDEWKKEFTETKRRFYLAGQSEKPDEKIPLTGVLPALAGTFLTPAVGVTSPFSMETASIPTKSPASTTPVIKDPSIFPENIIPFLTSSSHEVGYQDTKEYQSATVPFKSKFCMVFAMPKLDDNLLNFINNHKQLIKALRPSKSMYSFNTVDLYVPSFELHTKTYLNPLLMQAGIKKAFNLEEHGFENMVLEGFDVYIGSAKQEAQIKVDSKGATARAITTFSCVACTVSSLPLPMKITLSFNHPFLFALWMTEPTEIPIFIGAFQG